MAVVCRCDDTHVRFVAFPSYPHFSGAPSSSRRATRISSVVLTGCVSIAAGSRGNVPRHPLGKCVVKRKKSCRPRLVPVRGGVSSPRCGNGSSRGWRPATRILLWTHRWRRLTLRLADVTPIGGVVARKRISMGIQSLRELPAKTKRTTPRRPPAPYVPTTYFSASVSFPGYMATTPRRPYEPSAGTVSASVSLPVGGKIAAAQKSPFALRKSFGLSYLSVPRIRRVNTNGS
jgi:hypothetical protein